MRSEAEAGFRAGTWRELDRTLGAAIDEGVISGGVLVVARNGVVVYERAEGVRDPWGLPSPGMTADTLFDTASLAKPVATASAAALAVREGLIDSGAPLEGGWSLDDLLLHRAGIPEYVEWQRVAELSVNSPACAALRGAMGEVKPAGTMRYSNVGYLLASCEVEDSVGLRLGEIVGPRLWEPLGMGDTVFRLRSDQAERVARAASDLRPGQAFDPLADYWMRVVTRRDPGHSGLFSTAPDLAAWSMGMMKALNEEADPMHDVARFVLGDVFEMRDGDGRRVRRTRGFLVREDDTLFGPLLEHTGFTGCVLWLDPQRELAVILLTCGADGESARWRRMGNDVLRGIRIGARHGGS